MKQPITLETPTTSIQLDAKCPDCNGPAEWPDLLKCPHCNGTGFILTKQGKAIAALVMRHFNMGWIPGVEE